MLTKRPALAQGRIIAILLAALLVGAGAARFFEIGERSYWLDESSSLDLAKTVPSHLTSYWKGESHPPLYYLLLRAWVLAFGESETSARSLSAIFGIVCVWLAYKVGSALFGQQTGLLSAALLALSVFHISHSQEARMYSLLAMLSLCCVHFFLKLMRDAGRASALAYVAASVLLLYTHLYGAFVLIALCVFLFCSREGMSAKKRREWLLLHGIIAALFLPWMLVLFLQSRSIASGAFVNIAWIARPGIRDIMGTLLLHAGSAGLLALLAIFCAYALLRRAKDTAARDGRILALLLIAVPILLPFLLSIFTIPIYNAKYTICASLFFYILAAHGLAELRPRIAQLAFIAVTAALLLVSVTSHYSQPESEPWRDVALFLDERAASSDLVIVTPAFAQPALERYSHREEKEGGAAPKSLPAIWWVTREPMQPLPPRSYALRSSTQFGIINVSEYRQTQ